MREVILDAAMLCSRESAHALLKEKLGFPPYYGANLDALHDCLTEAELTVRFVRRRGEETPVFAGIWRVFLDSARENPRLIVLTD